MCAVGDDEAYGVHIPLLQQEETVHPPLTYLAGPSRKPTMSGNDSTRKTLATDTENVPELDTSDCPHRPGNIAQTSLSFMDEFDVINGVPAFVLESNTSSEADGPCSFTCHAFSNSGKSLAVGDNRGMIRIWGTDNFNLVKEHRMDSGQSVGCVRFLANSESDFTCCDMFGCCERFSLKHDRVFRWTLPSVHEIQELFFVKDKQLAVDTAMDPDSTSAKIWAPCSSADGAVIAQAISVKTDQKTFTNSSFVFLTRTVNQTIESARVTAEGRSLVSRYRLSDNGNSLLVIYAPPRHPEISTASPSEKFMEVWPELRFGCAESESYQLPCRMGDWGNGGDFVIGWTNGTSVSGNGEICVWNTKSLVQDMRRKVPKPTPLIRHAIDHDDTLFHVEMVSPSRGVDSDDVILAICFAESDESNVLIHIWSSKRDVVLLQFNTGTRFEATLVGKRQYLNNAEVMGFYWGHNRMIMERSLIKICISPDKKWMAFYSSEDNRGYLWSLDGAIPVARLDLPANLTGPSPGDTDPQVVSTLKTIAFNSSGNELVLTGQNRMIFFVPAFLQERRGLQMQHIESAGENYVTYKSLHLSHDGSTMMLSGEEKPNNVSSVSKTFGPAFLPISDNGLMNARDHGSSSENSSFRRIPKDYALSKDGSVVAYIFVDNAVAVAKIQSTSWNASLQLNCFRDDSHYRIISRSQEDIFNRIFFASMPTGPDQLVCFCLQIKGSICWFDLVVEQQIERVALRVDQSLGVKLNDDQTRAVVLGTQAAQIIDLQRRVILETVNYNLSIPRARQLLASESGDEASVFFSGADEYEVSNDGSMVLIGWDPEHECPIYLKPETTSKTLKRYIRQLTQGINDHVWLSSDSRWLIVASEQGNSDVPQKGLYIYDTRKKRRCRVIPDHLDMTGCEPLFCISGDGRMIVMRSVFASKKDETTLFDVLVVLTPYAIEGSIPDYHRLEVTRKTGNPGAVKKLIEDFSWPVLNYPDSGNKSLFQHALVNRMTEWVNAFYDLGKKEGIPINLCWDEESGETKKPIRTSALQWAINMRSPDLVWDQLTRLVDQATTVNATASIIRSALPSLYMTFPALFLKLMESNMLIASYGKVPVAAKIFEKQPWLVGTYSDDMSWDPKPGPKVMKVWKSMGRRIEAKTRRGQHIAEVPGEGKFVFVKDVAQVGMRGIIRHLLMLGAPAEVFKCDLMRWTIAFKWETYGRKMCVEDFIAYIVLLVCFVIYALLLGSVKEFEDKIETGILIMIPLVISVALGLWNLKGEVTQLRRYMKDSEAAFQDAKIGRLYYLQSQWNWMEMISYVMMFPLPGIHIAAIFDVFFFNQILSLVVAIDGLLLCFKVLYFLQTFRRSGPLVLAIREVVLDVLVFLGLMFMILFGFSVAFNVMFRHSPDAGDSFGSLGPSMLTAYVAILGDFDLDTFRDAIDLSWLTTAFFIMYMIIMMIMLLNLLIGIMGDSFDRVRSQEEAEFLKGKASVIDDFEAGLSEEGIKDLEEKIGTYLHALVPLERPQELDSWAGKIRAFESVVEKRLNESEVHMKKEFQSIKDSIEELKRAIAPVP